MDFLICNNFQECFINTLKILKGDVVLILLDYTIFFNSFLDIWKWSKDVCFDQLHDFSKVWYDIFLHMLLVINTIVQLLYRLELFSLGFKVFVFIFVIIGLFTFCDNGKEFVRWTLFRLCFHKLLAVWCHRPFFLILTRLFVNLFFFSLYCLKLVHFFKSFLKFNYFVYFRLN